ncbi:HEPN domain-containing protein [Flavobacterium ginsenosidimutans]|uniref:HEPN domain-containing protein n=1 Tax=Flavobacterium ginsenosidimutans TaxID=687844 RepID=UPI000DAB797C|nr:HEPN domain-containing protein [Flavobacterium ginsenosidimutans]KAF2338040.1 hypothetical protein DM444_01285 [Flavobacterium ginsenosidimutans]
MPSKSYFDFLELLQDVEQLRNTHYDYSKGKSGRKKLGFLTRSSIVMLCAAWERYCENILLECVDKVLTTDIEAKALPSYIKEYIGTKVRENKNIIYPIELADNGWKNLWKGYAVNETNSLNTPNSENLKKLYKRFLGIEDFTTMWHETSITKINDFIKIRGEIAHNGSKAQYVRFNSLLSSIEIITENAIQIDYSLSQYLKNKYLVANTWEENYYRKLSSYKKISKL